MIAQMRKASIKRSDEHDLAIDPIGKAATFVSFVVQIFWSQLQH
jgi:hypothetical protein